MSVDATGRRLSSEVETLFSVMARHPSPPYPELGVDAARIAVEASVNTQINVEEPVVTEDLSVPTRAGDVRVRLYSAPEPTIAELVVYLHGGGWVTGSIEVADNACRDLALRTGGTVASIDYPRSPEAVFPAPYVAAVEVLDALAHLRSERGWRPDRLVLIGDSAGGNLAAAAASARRDVVTDLVLLYPALDDSRDSTLASHHENALDPILPALTMDWFWSHYMPDPALADERACPLRTRNLDSMPRTLVVTCELDVLRDEGRLYAARLRSAGNEVEEITWPGMVHGFWWMSAFFPQAGELTDAVSAWVRNVNQQAC